MLKATKLTLAAALLAGSCGLAMAQGSGASGAGGGKSPAGSGAHPKGNPISGTIKPAPPMTQKNTGMPTATKDAGQETGTAKDSAGTGQMREESKKEQHTKWTISTLNRTQRGAAVSAAARLTVTDGIETMPTIKGASAFRASVR